MRTFAAVSAIRNSLCATPPASAVADVIVRVKVAGPLMPSPISSTLSMMSLCVLSATAPEIGVEINKNDDAMNVWFSSLITPSGQKLSSVFGETSRP